MAEVYRLFIVVYVSDSTPISARVLDYYYTKVIDILILEGFV